MKKILIEVEIDWENYDDVNEEIILEEAISCKQGVGYRIISNPSEFGMVKKEEVDQLVEKVISVSFINPQPFALTECPVHKWPLDNGYCRRCGGWHEGNHQFGSILHTTTCPPVYYGKAHKKQNPII